MSVALITGINGMDGSILSKFLLEKKYIVYGIARKTNRIEHLLKNSNLKIFYGDITDFSKIIEIFENITQTHSKTLIEIYNLANQSDTLQSFKEPVNTFYVNSLGTLNLLEAIRSLNLFKNIKFFQYSSSEIYGKIQEKPQDENTPFYPLSPFATSKLYSYWIVRNYRETYGLFACNGILFSHTSFNSNENNVFKKITLTVGKILRKEEECLYLGNLDAKRDWGYAEDYVEGMWMILQHHKPDDFILSTGESHTIREIVELSFKYINIHIIWEGYGLNEVGKCSETGKIYVKVSEKYIRPNEVLLLEGNSSKAINILGWKPKMSFEKIIKIMVVNDI